MQNKLIPAYYFMLRNYHFPAPSAEFCRWLMLLLLHKPHLSCFQPVLQLLSSAAIIWSSCWGLKTWTSSDCKYLAAIPVLSINDPPKAPNSHFWVFPDCCTLKKKKNFKGTALTSAGCSAPHCCLLEVLWDVCVSLRLGWMPQKIFTNNLGINRKINQWDICRRCRTCPGSSEIWTHDPWFTRPVL